MKRNHLSLSLLTVLSWAVLTAVGVGEEIVLYDNTYLDAKAPPFVPPNAPPPYGVKGDTHGAIQFYTGDADNVSSASTTLKRTGTPGGKLVFEIWNMDEAGKPGANVGTLGELQVEDIPTELTLVSVEGSVKKLAPKTRYFLVFRYEGVDLQPAGPPSRTIHVTPLFPGTHDNAGPGTAHPPEGPPLEELLSYTNGRWVTLSAALGSPPGWQHARITAECPDSEPQPFTVDIEPAVAVSWDSQMNTTYQIHASTDMENWETVVEEIEGTGMRLTHCFLRQETQVFYRVEESR